MISNKSFLKKGYKIIEKKLCAAQLDELENCYQELIVSAEIINFQIREQKKTYQDFYLNNPNSLIVVPEAANQSLICRLEYLYGFSSYISTIFVPALQSLLYDVFGQKFVLFKDKCNIKNPGGGAFPPHQDITAYQYFKPKYHITVAVVFDKSTTSNGCLEIAENYREVINDRSKKIDLGFEQFYHLEYEKYGSDNGDINSGILNDFTWIPIEGEKGDIVMFDSYVPHQSKKNLSEKSRRIFFFTFNHVSEGQHYFQYYDAKRTSYSNPIFHVSTPTSHQAEK